jgi:uncharacterized protein
MQNQFFRYELRTTDVTSAQRFYAEVFGPRFWRADLSASVLPDRAIALGAPPHWLGHIGTSDIPAVTRRITALGGQGLGPAQEHPDGSVCAVFRDPFGAVMAVSSERSEQESGSAAWHLHHSQDHERSFDFYAGLFGWVAAGLVDAGPRSGGGLHQVFAWSHAGPRVGSLANTARPPQIHPHWLYFFPVKDIESSLARVRVCGGTTLGAMPTPAGNIVAPCDDPQGGAFGLYQSA